MMQNYITISLTPDELGELISQNVKKVLEPLLQTTNPPANPAVRTLTRKETAQFLGISPTTLWSHTKSGKIKAHRIGRRVLYYESDILNSLDKIRV